MRSAQTLLFFSSKSEKKAIAPSSLKQTYEVSLVSAGGTAYYVEVTDDTQKLEVYEGDLFDLNVGKLIALLNVNGDYVPYELSPNVSVVDSEGKGLTLGTLIKGSQVQFTKNKLIKDPKITGIIVKKAPVTKTSEGTVKMLSRTDLAVQETSSGNTESFPLSSKLVIVNKDNANVDFTQLRTGDTVGYEIVNNEVTKIVQKKTGFSCEDRPRQFELGRSQAEDHYRFYGRQAWSLLSDGCRRGENFRPCHSRFIRSGAG